MKLSELREQLERHALTGSALGALRANPGRDSWEEKIAEWVVGRENVSITEMLNLLGRRPEQHTQASRNRVAHCLKSLGWERFQHRIDGRREWCYRKIAVAAPELEDW
jgi:hypothetical protein